MTTTPASPASSGAPSPEASEFAATGIRRRTIAGAAAWTVPAVAIAAGAPMSAASPTTGQVVVSPSVGFVRPGDEYPEITITLHQAGPGAIVNTSNATVLVTLPAGYTWADGYPATAPRPFTGVTGGTLHLGGTGTGAGFGVKAAQDPTGIQTGGPISATATEANPATGNPTTYTLGSAPLSTAYNGTGSGTASGAIWADNQRYKGFALEGYETDPNPIPFATPMDVRSSFAGSILDATVAGPIGSFLVQKTGSGATTSTTVWATNTSQVAMTTGPQQYNSKEILIPAGRLRAGEYFVQVSAGADALTNFGRVFSFATTNATADQMPEFTFPVAAGQPQPFVEQIVGTRYGTRPSAVPIWSIARDSNGDVWSLSALGSAISDPSYAGDGQTHANLITPVKVSGVSNVVEVSAGVAAGMARTASGQVFTWGDNTTGFNAGGNGYVAGLPTIVKLGQTSNSETNNFGTVSVVAADGNLYSWGANYYGQNNTGAASLNNSSSGVTLNHTMDSTRGARKIVDVANVGPTTAVILDDNSVWSWGASSSAAAGGYLGAGSNSQTPSGVPSVTTTPLRVVRGKAGDPYPYPAHFATKFFDSNYQTYATDLV